MQKRYDRISTRCLEIVEDVMHSPLLPEDGDWKVKFRLCAEEAIENIISYAYGEEGGWMEISLTKEDKLITLTLKDAGKAFNPLEAQSPDFNTPILERKVGGLGIHFIKTLMDEIQYERKDGCNILTVKKYYR